MTAEVDAIDGVPRLGPYCQSFEDVVDTPFPIRNSVPARQCHEIRDRKLPWHSLSRSSPSRLPSDRMVEKVFVLRCLRHFLKVQSRQFGILDNYL